MNSQFFTTQKLIVEDGDLVIGYVNPLDMKFFNVSPTGVHSNRHGRFNHSDIIGKAYGTKVASTTNQGFIFILYPTPELWTKVLPHRTQILYQPDISLITTMLELCNGSSMIEAGTGSGSFSHSIARTIGSNGALISYEYHLERQIQSKLEFESHKLTNIQSFHRDVCKDGFDVIGLATAVFLDLPSPWECITHSTFKPSFNPARVGRVCCFSPCIEQVKLTCEALKAEGFHEIRMFEVLGKAHDVKMLEKKKLPTSRTDKREKRKWGDDKTGMVSSRPRLVSRGHTSYLTFATLYPSQATVLPLKTEDIIMDAVTL